MSTLHTVNKSPFSTRTLLSCLNHASDGDAVLMIEDAVYGAISDTKLSDAVAASAGSISLIALGPDLAARGIETSRLVEGVTVTDYAGFVDLAAAHDLTHAWL